MPHNVVIITLMISLILILLIALNFSQTKETQIESLNSPAIEPIISVLAGGLGNRLRNLYSCAILSAFTNRSLQVIWTQSDMPQNLKIEHLWSEFLFPVKYTKSSNAPFTGKNFDKWLQPDNEMVKMCFPFPANKVCSTEYVGILNQNILNPKNKLKISCYTSWRHPDQSLDDFITNRTKFLQSLKPSAKVNEYLQPYLSWISNAEKPVIGIHLRTGDACGHLWSKEKCSEMEEFVIRMINNIHEGSVLICSDSPTLRHSLQDNKNILIPTSSLNRNSIESQQQSYAEFLALSNCDCIIGTQGSTFSSESIHLNGGNCAFYMAPS